MGLLSRRRSPGTSGSPRHGQAQARSATTAHFREFVATRQGVKAYYETETPREPSALMLVTRGGEWTRRKVSGLKDGARLANELGTPFYEVVKTGYPDSVRQWNERKRRG